MVRAVAAGIASMLKLSHGDPEKTRELAILSEYVYLNLQTLNPELAEEFMAALKETRPHDTQPATAEEARPNSR